MVPNMLRTRGRKSGALGSGRQEKGIPGKSRRLFSYNDLGPRLLRSETLVTDDDELGLEVVTRRRDLRRDRDALTHDSGAHLVQRLARERDGLAPRCDEPQR